MKIRILTLCLIIFSLFGYLEWGDDKQQFIYQVEGEILGKLFSDPASIIHPFVLLPLIGQLFLLYRVIRPDAKNLFLYLGITGIGILLSLMLFIGIISSNFKIAASTLPFLITAIYTIWHSIKVKPKNIST